MLVWETSGKCLLSLRVLPAGLLPNNNKTGKMGLNWSQTGSKLGQVIGILQFRPDETSKSTATDLDNDLSLQQSVVVLNVSRVLRRERETGDKQETDLQSLSVTESSGNQSVIGLTVIRVTQHLLQVSLA